MSDLQLNNMSKGITDLAKNVTTSETVWKSFQMDPITYAKKNGYSVTLDATAVSKIRGTSYANAKTLLTSTDLSSSSSLW
jgi:histidine ammonia-lyase